jgi:hypothetical protein
VPELRLASDERVPIRPLQRRRQLELLRADAAPDLFRHPLCLRRRPDAQGGEHPRPERRVRCQRRRRLPRLRKAAQQRPMNLLGQRIELGLLPGQLQGPSALAPPFRLVRGPGQPRNPATPLLVARLDRPVLVDPGQQLAADVQNLGIACVDPDRLAVREADPVPGRDQRRLRAGTEHPPDRPHRVAQARPSARVQHVRPEATRNGRPRMQPGMERKPREQLRGPARRQIAALTLDLDAQLPEQMDAQHLVLSVTR